MKRFVGLVALFTATALHAQPPAETQITAPGPQGPLQGTMLAPAGGKAESAAPIVLIVPGSGPTDRDGNSAMGLAGGPLKRLAQGLAAKGVASVRIDKRGMFGSKAAVPDPNKVTIGDYADDVATWSATIRKQTGAPCIWVLGHSEGGLVALAAAGREGICGLVLVAAAGRPIGQVMREQLRSNPANAPLLDQALGAIDQLEAGKTVDVSNMHPALQGLFHPVVQPYFIDLMRYDPAAMIAKVGKPVLIVQGQRDLQISVTDANALKSADPQAKLVLISTMNHALKAVSSDDRAANTATYTDPDLPLAPGLVDAVAAFVKGGR